MHPTGSNLPQVALFAANVASTHFKVFDGDR